MDKFSASEQALGYLYQIRYALWLLIDGPEERELFIEKLDDIHFEEHGTPYELLQTKHHSIEASLTNSSPDLWKTIRVWATHFTEDHIKLPTATLSLITTSSAPPNSLASKLRPDKYRNCDEALQILDKIAKDSKNKILKPAFAAYESLTSTQKKELVEAIYILDKSPMIEDTTDLIVDRIKAAVSREHRLALFERLEGWWFGIAVNHLRDSDRKPITGFEVYDKLRSIAEQLQPDALPIDFLDAEPDEVDPEGDNRLFVHQLKVIDVSTKRIEKAILDYYRAFQQRSRWAREELLDGREVEQYEDRLVDEWERFALSLTDEQKDQKITESKLKKTGRQIYNWMEQVANYRIRAGVTEPYVMRGSYQILADVNPPRVWWHPNFFETLEKILSKRPKVA